MCHKIKWKRNIEFYCPSSDTFIDLAYCNSDYLEEKQNVKIE